MTFNSRQVIEATAGATLIPQIRLEAATPMSQRQT